MKAPLFKMEQFIIGREYKTRNVINSLAYYRIKSVIDEKGFITRPKGRDICKEYFKSRLFNYFVKNGFLVDRCKNG